ncbi:MAG TPA: type II toxin-antitoxin system prevent-host-death family antitoxin [Burkholderiaceae bacterium]
MHKSTWPLQDAKAQFSAVVEAALNGKAQVVTKRGKRAVVVLDAVEYDRLRQAERARAPGFIDHLLAMPRRTTATRRGEGTSTDRLSIKLRDVVLE